MKNRGVSHWMLLGPGWLLLAYLVYAQAIPAFDYDLGVSMGTQEPVEQITAVGVAFWIVLPLIMTWAAWGLWRMIVEFKSA